MLVNPPPPALPTPPPMRHVDVFGAPVQPKEPKKPNRFWCFFRIHRWEIHKESTWKRTNSFDKVVAQGPMYILRCASCGKMKSECL